jgi:hypothetical protein
VSNGSVVEALWALGARAQKMLKRPDARVGVRWKGTRKQLPKALLSAAFSQVSEISRRVSVVCMLRHLAMLQSRLRNDAEHGTKSGLRNGSLGDVRNALHTTSGDIGWLVLCNGNTRQGVGFTKHNFPSYSRRCVNKLSTYAYFYHHREFICKDSVHEG